MVAPTVSRVMDGLRHAGWPVNELLGAAVERPALDQLEVEVGRTWKIGSAPV